MALPAFATTNDLDARLPDGVEISEARKLAALDDASALIHAESAEAWVTAGELVDDVPSIALTVCCKAAIRALVNPAGAADSSTGPFRLTFGEVYLTSHERSLIKRAAGETGGLWTLSTTRLDDDERGDLVAFGTEYVAVVDQPGEPMPFLPVDWP